MSTNTSGLSSSDEVENASLDKKVEIAQRFDREMKDYAKATVKEFLGIYGYEEDVDMEESSSAEIRQTEATTTSSVYPHTTVSAVDSQPSGECREDSTSPVSPVSKSPEKEVEHNVTSVSISSSPSKQRPFTESGVWTQSSSLEDEGREDSVVHHNTEGFCRWCKKFCRLQDFTYTGDGSNVVYEGLCSSTCFDSVKRVRLGKEVSGFTENATLLDQDNSVMTFSWEIYLAQTQGTAAPWTCFKQSSSIPFNGFQIGMKLEAADPRNDGTVCVASVVGILGSRIRLRFDGCDNASDIWRMVDCNDIHPIGWCEGNGGVLQPPVGFRKDVGKFSTFLQKTLANGELAPLRLFKKVPHAPKANFFAPNHKLEVVDRKNPVLICVATVVEVSDDEIKIVFDGWKGSSKYTYRYDSRDIFPVGWCYFSGHPLQPPGPEYLKPRKHSAEKHQLFNSAIRSLEVPSQLTYPLHSRGSPAQATADSASDGIVFTERSILGPRIPVRAELYINQSCDPGPYLDPIKVSHIPIIYQGRIRDVLQASVQAIVDAAINPKTVLGFLQPGRGKVVIKAQHGKEDAYTCCLQNVDRASIFWNVITRFSDNLRCCKNLFSANKLDTTCPKCYDEGGKIIAKAKRDMEAKRRNVEIVFAEKEEPSTKRQRRISEDEMVEDIGSTSSPTTWSTDEVVKYFRSSDISQYAEVFRDHEIDGGALLLLTRETIMTCMQFKLGPALKLLSHIDQLKTRFGL